MTRAAISSAPMSISHSVLDVRSLAAELARRYTFDGPPVCQLFYRGMNDIYIVHDDARRYALRAWRANWRSVNDVTYELEFLDFLQSRKIPVAGGIKAIDGSPFFLADVPEGPRPIGLFQWAEGKKFGAAPDAGVARNMGAMFARIHIAGADFRPSVARTANPSTAFLANLVYLKELLFDRPDDLKLYTHVAEALTRAVKGVETSLPRGPNHGDFHFNNVHVKPGGDFTLLDFDNAGDDCFIQDLACYTWANNYGGHDPIYAEAFIEGYGAVRALTADEKASFDLFLLAKEFRLLVGFTKHMNCIGHAPLRFRDLDWFATSISSRAQGLGLL